MKKLNELHALQQQLVEKGVQLQVCCACLQSSGSTYTHMLGSIRTDKAVSATSSLQTDEGMLYDPSLLGEFCLAG